MKDFGKDEVNVAGLKERLLGQQKKFDLILKGVESGEINLQDLSLGVDNLRGIRPACQLSEAPEVEEIIMRPEMSHTIDEESRTQFEIAQNSLPSEHVPGGKSYYLSRLFLQHDQMVDGMKVINKAVLSRIAGVLKMFRQSELPVKFKPLTSDTEVVYGRALNDTVTQCLVLMNQFSAWDLAEEFGSFEINSLPSENKIAPEAAIVDRAFFVIDFPGNPHFDSDTFPVDPSLAFRDRIGNAVGKDKRDLFGSCLPTALALKLGRLGATSRACYKVVDGVISDENGLITESNNRYNLEWWLKNKEAPEKGDGYVIRRTSGSPVETRAIIYHDKVGGIGALVGVKPFPNKDEEIFFYLRADQEKYPEIVAAANALIN